MHSTRVLAFCALLAASLSTTASRAQSPSLGPSPSLGQSLQATLSSPPNSSTATHSPPLAVGRLLWDRHEFTVGELKRHASKTGFVSRAEREGGGFIYESGWVKKQGWTWQAPFGIPAADDEPAVHITFDEAQAICQARGARLPTDEEWRAAAYLEQRSPAPAGWVAGKRYPFPNGDSARASHCLSGCGDYKGRAPAGALDRGVGHVAVATTAPGVNGLFDMGGNVWEWVATGSGNERVTRGASWWYGPERQREDDLATKPRDTRVAYIGFRCVRDQSVQKSQ